MQIINLMGNRYTGTIGKALTAGTWKGRNYIRGYRKPKNPKTEQQVAQRDFMTHASEEWRDLLKQQKEAFNRTQTAKIGHWTSYNDMVSRFINLQVAGEEFEPPPIGVIECKDSVTGDPIRRVICRVFRKDAWGAGYVWRALTQVTGKTPVVAFIIGEEPYDLDIRPQAPYSREIHYDLTAAEVLAVFELVAP